MIYRPDLSMPITCLKWSKLPWYWSYLWCAPKLSSISQIWDSWPVPIGEGLSFNRAVFGVVLRTFETNDPKWDPVSSVFTLLWESLPLQTLPRTSAINKFPLGDFRIALDSRLFLLRAASILAASPRLEGFLTTGLIRAELACLEPPRGSNGLKFDWWVFRGGPHD